MQHLDAADREMRNASMRRRIILLAIVLAVGALSGHARGEAQPTAGRIEGVAKDPSGSILPGVKVTLTGGKDAAREFITGADGRFVFEDLPPGTAYAIRSELTGFSPDMEMAITVVAGETRTIELELYVGCYGDLFVTGITDLDELLSADAIAHVRVGGAGEDRNDRCGPTRQAVVLSAARFSQPGERIGKTFGLMGAQRFIQGREYLLAVKIYGTKRPRAAAIFEREVVRGRIRGEDVADLGIRGGMPVSEALTRLRDARERNSR